jgi:hypothetical protein
MSDMSNVSLSTTMNNIPFESMQIGDNSDVSGLKGKNTASIVRNEKSSLSFRIKNAFAMPHFATRPLLTLLTIYLFSFYESLAAIL